MNKPRLDFSPDEAAFLAMNAHDLVWRWDQHAFPVDEVQAEMRARRCAMLRPAAAILLREDCDGSALRLLARGLPQPVAKYAEHLEVEWPVGDRVRLHAFGNNR